MGSIVHLYLLTVLSCCGTQGLALVIANGPMNVTVCSGTNATISCGFTGVFDPWSTLPDWRIIKRNNSGYVISNETVRVMDINANRTDGLVYFIIKNNRNGIISANNSYLSVGPVDDTYNNTSYQCIFTINDTIIESDTAGTVTVIGSPALTVIIMKNITNASIVVQWNAVDDSLHTTYTVTWTDDRDLFEAATVEEQTSYTITGLTLDTVYTITVTAAVNKICDQGPEFSTSVVFSMDTTSTTHGNSPTVTASTTLMITTVNPSSTNIPSSPTVATISVTTTVNGNADNSASRNFNTSITTTSSTIATNIAVSSTNTPTTDRTSDSSNNVGIIAGAAAAVGGIIIAITIVLIIFIVCYLGRRKNAEKNNYNDLAGDGTLNKTTLNKTSVPNPLDTNCQLDKPESSQQPEVLHMTSDIENEELPHPYISLEELRPQTVIKILYDKSDSKTETQHQQTMEYAVIDNGKKKEQEHHNRETDIQLQQPMEYAVTVMDNSEKKNKKGDKQQSGGTDAQHQAIEYAVVDKSKKKNRKKDKQQNADQEPSDVPTVTTSDSTNQNKNNPLLHYAELDTLPAPTDNFINEDNSRTPYALVS